VEKSSPKIWAPSVIFETPLKVNKRPSGENSPYLVTLVLKKKTFRELDSRKVLVQTLIDVKLD
jgi:hypothetical protein